LKEEPAVDDAPGRGWKRAPMAQFCNDHSLAGGRAARERERERQREHFWKRENVGRETMMMRWRKPMPDTH